MRVSKEIQDRIEVRVAELGGHYRQLDALKTVIALEVASRKIRTGRKDTAQIWKEVESDYIQ